MDEQPQVVLRVRVFREIRTDVAGRPSNQHAAPTTAGWFLERAVLGHGKRLRHVEPPVLSPAQRYSHWVHFVTRDCAARRENRVGARWLGIVVGSAWL